jgi:hypothetical protein
MEHRRMASFGIYSLLLAATTALAAPSSEQGMGGSYRGTYVCQNKLGAGPDILRVPIDLVIRNGNVEFARPLLNRFGTRVIGNEIAHGTTDPDGKIHLTSTWRNGGIFHAEYSGTLTESGGTFTGTQIWRGPRGQNGSRTCTAAFVQLAATDQSSPQRSQPDQSPTEQILPDQSPSEE